MHVLQEMRTAKAHGLEKVDVAWHTVFVRLGVFGFAFLVFLT